jgi:hypothetical protein
MAVRHDLAGIADPCPDLVAGQRLTRSREELLDVQVSSAREMALARVTRVAVPAPEFLVGSHV